MQGLMKSRARGNQVRHKGCELRDAVLARTVRSDPSWHASVFGGKDTPVRSSRHSKGTSHIRILQPTSREGQKVLPAPAVSQIPWAQNI